MPAQAGEFLPVLAPVARAENGGVFHAGVHRVGFFQRRLQMPHPLELPGMLRTVVELMRGKRLAGSVRSVVDKLVARGLRGAGGSRLSGRRSGLMPGFAAIIGALNDLPKPAAGLRCIQTIRIGGRSPEMVNFPTREVRAAYAPLFALAR